MQIQKRFISKNFTKGRQDKEIKFIVLHTMDGKGSDLQSWFESDATKASTHFSVGLNGDVFQYVREEDTAWANSNWQANLKAISIEFADNGNPQDKVRTNDLYNAGIELIADLIDKHLKGSWASVGTIKLHKYFDSGKSCPGGLDIVRICDGVNDLLAKRRNTPAGVVKKLKAQLQAERDVNEQLRMDIELTNQMNKNLTEEITALSEQIAEVYDAKTSLTNVYRDFFGDESGFDDLAVDIIQETTHGSNVLQRWANFIDQKVKSKTLQSILKYDIFVLIGWFLSLPTIGLLLTNSGISDTISQLLSPAFTIPPLTITSLAVGVTAVLFKLLVTRYDTNKDGRLDFTDTIVLKGYARSQS